jgi:hypothetical protein
MEPAGRTRLRRYWATAALRLSAQGRVRITYGVRARL